MRDWVVLVCWLALTAVGARARVSCGEWDDNSIQYSWDTLASDLNKPCVEDAQPADVDSNQRAMWQLMCHKYDLEMQLDPLLGTGRGESKYNHLLPDRPLSHFQRYHDAMVLFRARLERTVRREQLPAQQQWMYDVLAYNLDSALRSTKFRTWHLALNQVHGFHVGVIADLTIRHPTHTMRDLHDYVARLHLLPAYFSQRIDALRDGVRSNRTATANTVRTVLSQLATTLNFSSPRDSVFWKPITRLLKKPAAAGSSPSPSSRSSTDPLCQPAVATADIQLLVERAIEDSVRRAWQLLSDFLSREYLPAARATDGLWGLPDGRDTYAQLLADYTTTKLTAAQVHQMGLDQVRRLRGEMEALARAQQWPTAFEQLRQLLATNTSNYFVSEDEIVPEYQRNLALMRPRLPRFFSHVPEDPLEIKPIPKYRSQGSAVAYYSPGAKADPRHNHAVKPSSMYIATTKPETHARYDVMCTAFHEGLPGHHLQHSIARNLPALPRQLTHSRFIAFIEGWGLYAEWLGKQMGFFTSPFEEVGRLNQGLKRAVRLVVDTGLHHIGWSRAQAIAFMRNNTFISEHEATLEIDRYIVMPGQATTYMVGFLTLQRLNAAAQAALGEDFRYPDFHDAVLRQGALPLHLLERIVGDYLARRKQQIAAHPLSFSTLVQARREAKQAAKQAKRKGNAEEEEDAPTLHITINRRIVLEAGDGAAPAPSSSPSSPSPSSSSTSTTSSSGGISSLRISAVNDGTGSATLQISTNPSSSSSPSRSSSGDLPVNVQTSMAVLQGKQQAPDVADPSGGRVLDVVTLPSYNVNAKP